jgi:kynureninase
VSASLVAERSRFPILAERSYFSSQCLGPVPRDTFEDLKEFTKTLTLRSRGLETWLHRMYELIGLLEKLLDAPPGSVALRDSATAAHSAILSALRPTRNRNRIVTCQALHFKSTRYLLDAQERQGFAVVDQAPDGAWLAPDLLTSVVDERTAVVSLPLVSPVTGTLLPIAEIAGHARHAGAITIVDAYQGAGIVPATVASLGADVIIGGTHKWLCGGDAGLAFMYVRPELAASLEPAYPGWIGHRDLTGATPEFEPAAGALRFQQGTPAMAPIYTARAGLSFALETGIDRLRQRSLELTTRLFAQLSAARIPITTPSEPERRGGMLCIPIPDADRLIRELASDGIDVDVRSDAGLRVGPFPCLTEAECDTLARRIVEHVSRTSSV